MKSIVRRPHRRHEIQEGPEASPGTRHDRSRGQVLVIFAGAAFVLMALMALVIDVSWYWANTLKVQRAADAAALAGAVWLPGDAITAANTAKTEAKKNGYTDGSGGVTVAATQDTTDPRQLDVQVSAPVSTFFMRAVGINSINAARTSKGLYVLPVPMGSPLAYYGVGDFYVNTGNPPVSSVTPFAPKPASASWGGGSWTNPDHAWLSGTGASNHTTTSTDNQGQAWSTLNFNTGAITGTISGVVVSFSASVASGSSCQVEAAISWNNGSTWGDRTQTTGNLSTTDTAYLLGSSGDPTVWDSGHTWVAGDFANNGAFRVQLRYHKNSCGTLSLNQLAVTVYSDSIQRVVVKDPNNTILPSLGAWGAIITRGGNEQNGDAYAPQNNGGGAGFSGGANALYNGGSTNGGGYLYAVKLPAGGTVSLFDPGFCAMGGNPSGAGNLGAGDHWISGSGTAVSTYYTLWNTNGLLGLDPSSWGTPLYSSGTLFADQKGYDPDNVTGSAPGGATSGCDAYHNAWFTLPTGTLAAGTYALQVSTTKPTDASKNSGTNAENMFAIEAIGSGSPTIYGNGKMAVYNNLQPGNSFQLFYLAKIDRNTGAGKTALIDIFDPGDVPGNAVLKVLSPDGGGQSQATFTYTTDGNCGVSATANAKPQSDACASAGNVNQITTAVNGSSSFNNTWIHIRIPLLASYGSGGLWQGGWWQIRYETPGGGNDTTTWQVSISGNPVHLVVP